MVVRLFTRFATALRFIPDGIAPVRHSAKAVRNSGRITFVQSIDKMFRNNDNALDDAALDAGFPPREYRVAVMGISEDIVRVNDSIAAMTNMKRLYKTEYAIPEIASTDT